MSEVYYGLKAKPFDPSPDPDYFYQSSSHEQGLYYLRYGIQMGEGVLIVIGVLGSGKRMLVQALSPELAQLNAEFGHIDAAVVSHDNALRLVADAFGIACPPEGNDGLHNLVREYFVVRASGGKRLLMVVENAEQLSQKLLYVLRVLAASFQADGKSLLRVILLGQPALRETLSAPEMEKISQGSIVPCYLKPMTPADMRGYIEHRLNIVGWTGKPMFTGQGLDLIYCSTGGVPGLVNELCGRLMQHAWDSGEEAIYGYIVTSILKALKHESAAVWGDADINAAKPGLAPLPERRKNRRRDGGVPVVDDGDKASPYVWRRDESSAAPAPKKPHVDKAPVKQVSPPDIIPLAHFQRSVPSDMPLLFNDLPRVRLVEKPVLISLFSALLMAVSLGVFLSLDNTTPAAPDEDHGLVLQESILERPPEMKVAASDDLSQEELVLEQPPELSQEELALEPPPAETRSAVAESVPVDTTEKTAVLKEPPPVKVPPAKVSPVVRKTAPRPPPPSLVPPPIVKQKPPPKIDTPASKGVVVSVARETPPAKKPAVKQTPARPSPAKASVPTPAKKELQAPVAEKPQAKKSATPDSDMQLLLDKLLAGYNKGDIGAVLTLLSNKVEIDGNKGKYLVSQAYMTLFKSTTERHASYDAMQWHQNGNTTIGKGRYEIRIKYTDGQFLVTQGDVIIELLKTWDGLRINKITHSEKQ